MKGQQSIELCQTINENVLLFWFLWYCGICHLYSFFKLILCSDVCIPFLKEGAPNGMSSDLRRPESPGSQNSHSDGRQGGAGAPERVLTAGKEKGNGNLPLGNWAAGREGGALEADETAAAREQRHYWKKTSPRPRELSFQEEAVNPV